MKTILALLTAALIALPAQAQLFRPEAANGAAWGAIAGAIIGHNSGDLHHNAWKGAAIGAGAGLLLGSAFGDNHSDGTYYRSHAGYPRTYGYYGASYGYRGYRHSPSYGYNYGPSYYPSYRPSYYASYSPRYYTSYSPYYSTPRYYSRSNYAGSGALLGGLVGAIIGHNSGDLRHNGWKGAAIGAGAGLLLGSIADNYASDTVVERPVIVDANPVVTTAAAAQTTPQNVTIINNYYNGASTQMASANSLYGR